MKNNLKYSLAILVFLTSAVFGENGSVPPMVPFDPFSMAIIKQSQESTRSGQVSESQRSAMNNDSARKIADGYVNKSEVPWDTQVPQTGREYAHNASSRDANAGAIVAGITGGLLASAGAGYIAAGNLPLGSALLTMAGMEFAQMAASASASQQNKALQNRLEFNHDAPSAGVVLGPDSSQTQRPELSPKLDEFLKQNKIDPETFKEALFSGTMTDQESVLKALGANPDQFSKADLQKGFDLAQEDFNKASQEALAQAKMDPSFLAGNSGSASKTSDALKETNGISELKASEEGSSETKGKKNLPHGPALPAASESFFSNMYNLPASSFSNEDQALLWEGYLRDQGIVVTPSRMNIFQVAQQSYRSFSKTKKKSPSKKSRMAQLN